MGNKLYVGNLSYNTLSGTLESLFAQAGTVSTVEVMMDRFTNRPRGFAFVTMSNDEEAAKAVNMFNGMDVDGRPIVVNEAKPLAPRDGAGGGERRPRSGGFGGGGGDRGGFGGGGDRGGFGGGGRSGGGDRGGRSGGSSDRGGRGGNDRGDRRDRY